MCFDGGVVTGPMIAGLVMTAASTALTAVGQYQAGKAQEKSFKYNAKIQEIQAQDAEQRGRLDEIRARQRARLILGSQRAEQGASGTVADTGSNLDILAQSAEYGGRDAMIAKMGGEREAFGHRSQATLDKYGGAVASSTLYPRIAGTALTSASSAFNSNPWWANWKSRP